MLQYDLTETGLARDDKPCRVPTEGELMAVTVALLLDADCSFDALNQRTLCLSSANHERVAQLIEEHVWPLTRDIGSGTRLRARLSELTGLRISQT